MTNLSLFDWAPSGNAPAATVASVAPSGGIRLRDYQEAAKAAVYRRWETHRKAAVEIFTGGGKTTLFGAICLDLIADPANRVLVLAHRDELIGHAVGRLEKMTGRLVEREQADSKAYHARVVVGSVQTLCRVSRLARWKHDAFTHVIIDESHHGTAQSYRRIYDYFGSAKLLGVSATLDRADGKSVLEHADELVYRMTIDDGITGGWLVPIKVRTIFLESMDLSGIKKVAGDLSQAETDAIVGTEKNLWAMAEPLTTECPTERALVFSGPTVETSIRMTEVLNRYLPGSAREVNGKTDGMLRRRTFDAHRSGEFTSLVNVDIATEGYDDPGVKVVAICCPTMSRPKHAQRVGRVLRPLCKVDDYATAEERRAAIAASEKPFGYVYDFVGACNLPLVTTVDLLSGNYDVEVVKRAKKNLEKEPVAMPAKDALEKAKRQLEDEAAAKLAAERRKAIKAKCGWRTVESSPFTALGMPAPESIPGDRLATREQVSFLERNKIKPPAEGWRFVTAQRLVTAITQRAIDGLASPRQVAKLTQQGIPNAINLSRKDAGVLCGLLESNRNAGMGYRFKPGDIKSVLG